MGEEWRREGRGGEGQREELTRRRWEVVVVVVVTGFVAVDLVGLAIEAEVEEDILGGGVKLDEDGLFVLLSFFIRFVD